MNQTYSGKLYYIEGIDGAGKSSLIAELASLCSPHHTAFTKEPGSTPVGSIIKNIVYNHDLCPQAQFLLFAADRSQHVSEKVQPWLKQGMTIFSDRGPDSSLIYQGCRYQLDTNMLQTINSWALQGIKPHKTIYLRITPDQALKRIQARNGAHTDQFEQQVMRDLEIIYQGFEDIYTHNPDVITLDATKPSSTLAQELVTLLELHVVS